MPPLYVADASKLKDACAALAGAPRYFVDTEFEMSGPVKRLCLLQVSSGGPEVWLVDPLKLPALEPLGAVIGRPDAEWVLHAGNQDVPLIRESLKIAAAPRLFDTQVGWGLTGPEYPVSLAYLLYRILGLRSAKAEQAGPWMTRPLTPEQLDYAAGDVAHLPEIRDWLLAKLPGREDLLREVSAESILPEPPEPMTLEEFRNAWQLDAAGQAALRHLIDWWNGLSPAERLEGPQPRVFLTMAKILPETGAELQQIKGIPYAWARKHGDAFTGRLLKAGVDASRAGFTPLEPPPYNTPERILAGGWIRHAAAKACVERSIAPELAFPDRIVRKMVLAAVEKQSKAAAAELLVGWRERELRDVFLRHVIES